jgi:hypothetical protein
VLWEHVGLHLAEISHLEQQLMMMMMTMMMTMMMIMMTRDDNGDCEDNHDNEII